MTAPATTFLFLLIAATCAAAPTNWPSPPRMVQPNTVPTPPLPGINVPEPPMLPTPASPYLMPLTNAPSRPKAMKAPSVLPSGWEMWREGFRQGVPVETYKSIAATQTVQYVEPRQPKPPPVVLTNQVWHVALNGSDANYGTNNTPFRTIQKAAAAAQAGDTVVVARGAYDGFRTVRSGKTGQPITFKAQGEVVILSNTNTPADHILVRDTDWIVIEGFICREAPRAGIAVLDSADVVISNNVCGPNGKWGIFTGFTPRIQILHNKAFSAREQHGIYVSNSHVPDDNPVLRGNECFDNGASGIQLNGDCNMGGDGFINGALLEGNIVHDNDSKGLSLISIEGSRIQNNLIYNNGRRYGAGGIHLTDEPGCGKASHHNIVVNNTVMEPRVVPIRLSDDARKNVIFNNLIIGRRGITDEVGDNQIDGDTNLRSDVPADFIVNPAEFDFHLLGNSRAGYAGKSSWAEKIAPTNDIGGVLRSAHVPSVGAYDLAPAQR